MNKYTSRKLKYAFIVIAIVISIFAIETHAFTVTKDNTSSKKKVKEVCDNLHTFYQNHTNNKFPTVSFSVLLPNSNTPIDCSVGYQQNPTKQVPKPNMATANMLVQYGSITKAFTSTLIVKLINTPKLYSQRNTLPKLNLHTTLQAIFPERFSSGEWPEIWGVVTIKQLLNMTSGITDSINIANKVDLVSQNFYSLEELVNKAASYQKLHGCADTDSGCFTPAGSAYNYSNTNYLIAGMIIEKYYGTSYRDAINQYILKPFYASHKYNNQAVYYVMNYTYPNNLPILENMIHGYAYNSEIFGVANGIDITKDPLYWASSAGGLTGSVNSLTFFAKALWVDDLFGVAKYLRNHGVENNTGNGTLNKPSALIKPTPENLYQCAMKTENNDSECFGLGVTSTTYDNTKGMVIEYAGGTLGFSTEYHVLANGGIVAWSMNKPILGSSDFPVFTKAFTSTIRTLIQQVSKVN